MVQSCKVQKVHHENWQRECTRISVSACYMYPVSVSSRWLCMLTLYIVIVVATTNINPHPFSIPRSCVPFDVRRAKSQTGLHSKYDVDFPKFCTYLDIDYCPPLEALCIKYGCQSATDAAKDLYELISRQNKARVRKAIQMAAAFLVACEACGVSTFPCQPCLE